MRHPLFALASLLLASAAACCAAAPAAAPAARPAPTAENTGPNSSILRRASGQYRYETISNGRVRGEEHWQLLVHPDGSRTMQIWHDLAARNAQFTVTLRVADNFRPLEAFVSYWNGGAFKGSAHFRVDGAKLLADSAGPYGTRNETIDVPEKFSIGTHPVAGDGWHTWAVDQNAKGVQTSTFYALEASTDLTKPVLGTLTPLKVEIIGPETITVPAGRFDTLHLRMSGINDLWITPKDRLVIKSVIAPRDLSYVLTSATGDLR